MAPGDSETAAVPELVEPDAKPDEADAGFDEHRAAEHGASEPSASEASASEGGVSERSASEHSTSDHRSADNSAAEHGSAAPSPAAPELSGPDHGTPAHDVPAHDVLAHDVSAHDPHLHAPTGVHSAAPAAASPTAPLVESGQIRRAIAIAQKRTDLNWSVFIGTLGPDPRVQAEARHAEIGPTAAKSVLIAVDPAAHHLEIVTGTHARQHLDDRSCALAAAAMTSSFAVRDLDGGIAYGILAMVEHVRSVR